LTVAPELVGIVLDVESERLAKYSVTSVPRMRLDEPLWVDLIAGYSGLDYGFAPRGIIRIFRLRNWR
jgi:hypothetical protein